MVFHSFDNKCTLVGPRYILFYVADRIHTREPPYYYFRGKMRPKRRNGAALEWPFWLD